MTGEKRKVDVDVDDVSGRLAAGIQTCRAVISNYRSLLSERGLGVPSAVDQRPAQSRPGPTPLRD